VSVWHYLGLAAAAAVVTLVLTPLVRFVSVKMGLVDEPGGRKVHTKPIPRLGGVAIYLGFMAAVATQLVGERFFGFNGNMIASDGQLVGVLLGVTTVFIVGVADDIWELEARWKLLGQVAAACIVIAMGLRVDFVGNPLGGGLIDLGIWSYPVTLLYIVGFTNVINLIDGLDGLAAGVTAIAAIAFLVLATLTNQLPAAAMAAALAGACVAFLRYNFYPASIFMGDSGSMFLGFTLATISLVGVLKSAAAITLVLPLLIIGVPLFDTLSAIVRRVRHQQPMHLADKGHIHHRLLSRGFSQRQAVLVIYAWSALLAVGGYSMRLVPTVIKVGVFVVLAALSALMAYWLGLLGPASGAGDPDGNEGTSSL
jgi:UDP-GlcNAc:undecaprenyl-phosphate GlcNAc-1-phosphate transferase